MRSVLTLSLAWLLAGCGGMSDLAPACQRIYQDCTDICADRCETAQPADDNLGPPPISDNATSANDCADCVSSCKRKARTCQDRALERGE